ncbi:MAG: hypothetical protein ABH986_01485 [archaeon]
MKEEKIIVGPLGFFGKKRNLSLASPIQDFNFAVGRINELHFDKKVSAMIPPGPAEFTFRQEGVIHLVAQFMIYMRKRVEKCSSKASMNGNLYEYLDGIDREYKKHFRVSLKKIFDDDYAKVHEMIRLRGNLLHDEAGNMQWINVDGKQIEVNKELVEKTSEMFSRLVKKLEEELNRTGHPTHKTTHKKEGNTYAIETTFEKGINLSKHMGKK